MKTAWYVLIVTLILCNVRILLINSFPSKSPEPKYSLGDVVSYTVPHLYKNICDGTGKLVNYFADKSPPKYEVETNAGCPNLLFGEDNIQLIPQPSPSSKCEFMQHCINF